MSAQSFAPLASHALAGKLKSSNNQVGKTMQRSQPAKHVSHRRQMHTVSRSSCSRCHANSSRPVTMLRAAESEVSMDPIRGSAEIGCTIDDIESGDCSLADLEMMYIDALWSYYNKGEFTLTDDQYDRLREELNWMGSGFPTLRRSEVAFVEASIAYARGQPCVSDEEYDDLKREVKKLGNKRADVTALLLYTKGKELLDESEYSELAEEMQKLGIDVGLRGAACTLSTTSDECPNNVSKVAQAYAALAIVPTAIGLAPFIALAVLGVDAVPLPVGAAVGLAIGAALTTKLIEYVDLQDAEILMGQCPCCESEVKAFFGGKDKKDSMTVKCQVCATVVRVDRETKKLTLEAGPKYVEA